MPDFRKKLPAILSACLFVALIAAVAAFRPALFQYADGKLYDALLAVRTPGPAADGVAIVSIDEASLAQLGQWPWSRTQMAVLFDTLRRSGATVVVPDMVFAEPDRTADSAEDRRLRAGLAAFGMYPEGAAANLHDRMLAGVLSKGPYCLGYNFFFDGNKTQTMQHLPKAVGIAIVSSSETTAAHFYEAHQIIQNLNAFSGAPCSGFLNAAPDRDGILRRVPLLIRYRSRIYPSLALAAVMRAKGWSRVDLILGSAGLEQVHVGSVAIPIDDRGNLLIDYRSNGADIVKVSAAAVLNGSVPHNVFRNRIVLVGAVTPTLEKPVTSPLGSLLAGVEIHAAVIDNLLKGRAISSPSHRQLGEVFSVLLLGIVSYAYFRHVRPIVGMVGMLVGLLMIFLLSVWAMRSQGLFISPLLPMLTVGGLFPLIMLQRLLGRENESLDRKTEHSLMQDFLTQSLTSLASLRDDETGTHLQRTQRYLRILSETMARNPDFRSFLTAETVDLMARMAPLHDIGKVGVPDQVLCKHGPLTELEFAEVKKHTIYGREAIQQAQERVGLTLYDFDIAKELVYTHHERWDGNGYPQGLKGEAIPIPGRLMAVVDVYDALVTRRCYKGAVSHDEAVRLIAQGRGSQFDPAVVDGFLSCEQQLYQVLTEERTSHPDHAEACP